MSIKNKKLGYLFSLYILLFSSSLHAAEAPPSSPPLLPQSHSQKTFDPYTEDLQESQGTIRSSVASSPSSFDEIGYDRQSIHLDTQANLVVNDLTKVIEDNNLTLILSNLKKSQAVQPQGDALPIVSKLLKTLNTHQGHNLNNGIKQVLLQQTRSWINAAFVYYSTRKQRIPKHDQQALISDIEGIMNALQTCNQPITSLQYDLQVLRAAVNTLAKKDSSTSANKALIALLQAGCYATISIASQNYIAATKEGIKLTSKAIQEAYNMALNAYRTKWYIQTLYIDVLAQQVINQEDPEALLLLQNLLPRIKKQKTKKPPTGKSHMPA